MAIWPSARCAPAAPSAATTADAPPPELRLLHQDARCVVVDKPAGLLVHRSALDAHADEDLLSRLQQQLGRRLWPVHRLDKGTSGLLLLACDADAAAFWGRAWQAGAVDKRYLALVRGWPAPCGTVDRPLARDPEQPSTGQPQLPAVTHWQLLARYLLPLSTQAGHAQTRLALLQLQPLQGRRHQIRRHLKALAHPLVGDATHGKGPLNRALAPLLGLQRLWLHAQALSLPHPGAADSPADAAQARLSLQCPPGPEWQHLQRYRVDAPGLGGDYCRTLDS